MKWFFRPLLSVSPFFLLNLARWQCYAYTIGLFTRPRIKSWPEDTFCALAQCVLPRCCIRVLFTWARTLHSTPGPSQPIRGHIPCIIVGTKRESQECGQIWKKLAIQLIKYRWPRIVWALLLSPGIKDLCENSANRFKKINTRCNFLKKALYLFLIGSFLFAVPLFFPFAANISPS